MKRPFIGIITTSIVAQLCLSSPGFAAASLETSIEGAQKALEQQQFKKAETILKKAVELAKTSGTQDVNLARAEVMLATSLRGSDKVNQAGEALEQAHSVYKTLGFVEPAYVDELKNLAGSYQRIETDVLGDAGNALKNNSPVVSMSKAGTGGHVEIRLATAYENSLNSPKVDGVQLEKLVSFDIAQPDSSTIHISNIKGFKIHSVEKNTWVNLLELSTGAVDSEGKYDATITAGKAGITKTVPSKLPSKAYEPVLAIAKRLGQFGSVGAIDLPVVAAKPKEDAAATTTTPIGSPVTPTTTTTTPTETTVAPATTVVPTAPITTIVPTEQNPAPVSTTTESTTSTTRLESTPVNKVETTTSSQPTDSEDNVSISVHERKKNPASDSPESSTSMPATTEVQPATAAPAAISPAAVTAAAAEKVGSAGATNTNKIEDKAETKPVQRTETRSDSGRDDDDDDNDDDEKKSHSHKHHHHDRDNDNDDDPNNKKD
jgi:hypothetical protein